ncbi:MAG: aldehyde dehydrogenase [Flavobacteriales bacterium]|nr:aldehyde dehydrogenase [Flavobacteriales bacterium]
MKLYKEANLINGEWLSQGSGEFLKVLHKYNEELLAEIPLATSDQVDKAIEAAEKAFKEYSSWSAGERAAAMQKLYDQLEQKRDDFVQLIIDEAGKPRSYAENEVTRSLTTLKFGIEEARRIGGEVIPMDFDQGAGKTAFTQRFPIGVVGCITPFNFPLNLVMHKLAPALAAGCSLVIKPAPQSPLSCIALAELVQNAGFPKGLINVFSSENEISELMVKDERVKLLSFTGSDKVGWHLKSLAGKKKVALELGGNAAVLVDETVDEQKAAEEIAKGSYLYAGQICISTQRIIVQELVYEQFLKAFAKAAQELNVGDPNDQEVLVGPIIDQKHLERIENWVNEAVEAGAQLEFGAKVKDREHNLYECTLLSNVNSSMKVSREEAFAPLAVIEKFNTWEEGIRLVNESKYGLQVGVYTQSIDRMKMAFKQIEAGGVLINSIPGFRIDHMPYGGIKDSGIGREGLKYAIEEMTEPKLLVY